MSETITVNTIVSAPIREAWHYYTESEHVINWNFASPEWHCPAAINDLRVGGEFCITMAAKDGSMSFNLEGIYNKVNPNQHISYTLANGRKVTVDFTAKDEATEVVVTFDPEPGQARELQQGGWQAILENFRGYVNGLA